MAALLDASLVRLVLLPVMLRLTGNAAWWSPGWLNRVLPPSPSPLAAPPTTPTTERSTAMCRAVPCKTCGKTTWAGCGQHVNQVMAGVPRNNCCPGHPKAERTGGGFFRGLFGRRCPPPDKKVAGTTQRPFRTKAVGPLELER